MTEPETAGPPFIHFLGRQMPVRKPDEAQWAILIEAERHMTTVDKRRADIGDVPEDAPDDHPGRVRVQALFKESSGHLGRFMLVLGSLFLDGNDWDAIRDGMARGDIPQSEVYDLITNIIRACRDGERMEPDNRAAKRAKAKGTRAR